MKRTLVIANGDMPSLSLVAQRVRTWQPTAVIAADGGARHAEALSVEIDFLVGDLDSISNDLRSKLKAQGVHFEVSPVDKDETDLELALMYAAAHDAESIVVLGALGSRLDMSIANLMLLAHPQLAGAPIAIWMGAQTARLISPPGDVLHGAQGDTLSLIPLGGDARGITTDGLKYPLNGETLTHGPARGISNVLTGPTARIDLLAGTLLAVHTPEGSLDDG